MWSTRSRTPYAVDGSWGRNKNGEHEWIVAVRATFALDPSGRVRLADEQIAPSLAPEYHGEPGLSSLRSDADLVPMKPTTDVVLDATAHAPRGRPASEFEVGLSIGSVHKTLRVFGPRVWWRSPTGLRPSTPIAVEKIPIRYESAFGGWDKANPDPKKQKIDMRNPVGRGIAVDSNTLLDKPAHSIEYPGRNPETAGPAGFGPIASHWSPRIELLGTYDDVWQDKRMPRLPVDWDPRSLLASPDDQRPATYLRGGERVRLTNLTPDGSLQFELPKIYLTFTTHFSVPAGIRAEEHRGRLASVILEPDALRLSMVWVSSLTVLQDGDYLDETVVREKPYL